jgi:hypothetical protein
MGEKKANLVLTPIFDVSENFEWSIIHGWNWTTQVQLSFSQLLQASL